MSGNTPWQHLGVVVEQRPRARLALHVTVGLDGQRISEMDFATGQEVTFYIAQVVWGYANLLQSEPINGQPDDTQ